MSSERGGSDASSSSRPRNVDFYEQARRAADEIPGAGFLAAEELDHLGVDTAEVDPVLPAVLRTLRS